MSPNGLEIRARRKNSDLATVGYQAIKDGPLDTEINRDNAIRPFRSAFQTLIEADSTGLRPVVSR